MLKRHFAILAGVAFLFVGTATFAQTSTRSAELASQKMNPAQVQQDLAPLASAFGVKASAASTTDTTTAPAQETTTQVVPTQTEKTMAGVADRALDMVENVTVTISNTLKNMAPEVWRIMIRQQIAKAIAGPLGPLGWMLSAFMLWKMGGKIWPHMQDAVIDEDGMNGAGFNNICRTVVLKAVPIATLTIATLFLVGAVRDSILYLVNPEYYAIKDLLQSIMSTKAAVGQ